MKLVCDLLDEINKDIKTLIPNQNNQYLRNLLEHALIPEKKFYLPDGVPPYKVNQLPSAQLQGAMWNVCKKLYIFCRRDMKALQRESLFVTSLESVSKQESELLIAIKDQTFDKMYPNITIENINGVIPGYFKL
jgi:hypothetical protein